MQAIAMNVGHVLFIWVYPSKTAETIRMLFMQGGKQYNKINITRWAIKNVPLYSEP